MAASPDPQLIEEIRIYRESINLALENLKRNVAAKNIQGIHQATETLYYLSHLKKNPARG